MVHHGTLLIVEGKRKVPSGVPRRLGGVSDYYQLELCSHLENRKRVRETLRRLEDQASRWVNRELGS